MQNALADSGEYLEDLCLHSAKVRRATAEMGLQTPLVLLATSPSKSNSNHTASPHQIAVLYGSAN